MIKVHAETGNGRRTETFVADSFETDGTALFIRKKDALVAVFAPGNWSSVEKQVEGA